MFCIGITNTVDIELLQQTFEYNIQTRAISGGNLQHYYIEGITSKIITESKRKGKGMWEQKEQD